MTDADRLAEIRSDVVQGIYRAADVPDLLRLLDAATSRAEVPTSWLIERQTRRGPEWYAAWPYSRWKRMQVEDDTAAGPWTSEVNRALRFARKQDAETLIVYEGARDAFATEHA